MEALEQLVFKIPPYDRSLNVAALNYAIWEISSWTLGINNITIVDNIVM